MMEKWARYYDPGVGRFSTLDPFAGNLSDPQSLHKYAYVHGDPVQGVDPSGRNWSAASISAGSTVAVGLAGLAGISVGAYTNSAGSFYEGLLPGWGSGRGLGRAARNGDVPGVLFNGVFLILDLATAGGYSLLSGSAKAAPTVLNGVGRKEIEALFAKALQIATDPRFVQRAARAGLDPDLVPKLVERLTSYFDNGTLNFHANRFGAWADDTKLLFPKGASWGTVAHELTHVMDDVLKPGSLEASRLGTINLGRLLQSEYRAWFVQTGTTFGAYPLAFLTVWANKAGAESFLFTLRQALYFEAESVEVNGQR